MKIRWTQNSIRFRITPSEFSALENGQCIEEVLLLAGNAVWSTQILPQASQTHLLAAAGVLTLHLSSADLNALIAPDAEGVYFRDNHFRYFIEKDFPCAHPRASEAAEPETENFAAPPGFEERKNAP